MIKIIAAVGNHHVIGKDGKIPWHIPEDLKRFKRLTEGHCVAMGRKTFESLGSKPLKNRVNIVVSSNPKRIHPDAIMADGPLHALDLYETLNENEGMHLFVIGGNSLYKFFADRADMMHITYVDKTVEDADAFFPEREAFLRDDWEIINIENHDGYHFYDYIRGN